MTQDEKRFYQLELVNRETNFNKVFNTAPNVGVLNPLNASKVRTSHCQGAKLIFLSFLFFSPFDTLSDESVKAGYKV